MTELGDAHRSGDGGALAPVGRPRPFQRSKLAASAARTAVVKAEANGEGVGDLAGGAEVHLGGLAAAGDHGRAPSAAGATPDRPGPGVADIRRRNSTGLAASARSDFGPQLDLVAENAATSKACPVQPRKRSADVHQVVSRSAVVGSGSRREVLAEHGARSWDPAGWPNAWSWATASKRSELAPW